MNIKELLNKPIAFYPFLARVLGGINEAIYLQQFIYWSNKGSRKDGYIYKSKEEIEEETCLTRYQQDKVRKNLEELGVLETKVKKANGVPTLHYKVAFGKVRNLLMEKQETSVSEKQETSVSITENTTENTTENIYRSFEDFWSIYPRKVKKSKAKIIWNKLKPPEQEAIILDVKGRISKRGDPQWLSCIQTDKRYIPHPTTYLNGRCWEDEWEPVKSGINHETVTENKYAKFT